ncbi:hypothetical protein [Halobacillus amylolyticus]|uniref:Uncharacterized protein n=1 Tax=Halobacillus amylolyticus TaxID=2932259 RepID=A0ABY4H8E1_9BACI|nr:hypothetical protein [Halobacillus amylolyticus]UOR10967.1 hypothetical protein MUO15_15345 [Halobacillus amylolyticus]
MDKWYEGVDQGLAIISITVQQGLFLLKLKGLRFQSTEPSTWWPTLDLLREER